MCVARFCTVQLTAKLLSHNLHLPNRMDSSLIMATNGIPSIVAPHQATVHSYPTDVSMGVRSISTGLLYWTEVSTFDCKNLSIMVDHQPGAY